MINELYYYNFVSNFKSITAQNIDTIKIIFFED